MAKQPKPGKSGVGYCSPPKGTQFKPGQSGNPKGKPKAVPSITEMMLKEARKVVTVQTETGPQKITKAEFLVKTTFQRAAKDTQTLRLVLSILANPGPTDTPDKPMTDAELHVLKLAFSQMDNEGDE